MKTNKKKEKINELCTRYFQENKFVPVYKILFEIKNEFSSLIEYKNFAFTNYFTAKEFMRESILVEEKN